MLVMPILPKKQTMNKIQMRYLTNDVLNNISTIELYNEYKGWIKWVF